jgi:hypothetical protein
MEPDECEIIVASKLLMKLSCEGLNLGSLFQAGAAGQSSHR